MVPVSHAQSMPAQRLDKRAPFTAQLPKRNKTAAGRTRTEQTPLNIRASGVHVDDVLRERVRRVFGRKLGKFAMQIERGTVRLEDVNGPRGGVDVLCRIKVVLSNLPSVVLEDRGQTATEAFDRAVDGIGRAVQRNLGRAGLRSPKSKGKRQRKPREATGGASSARRAQTEGSLIGGRVGQSRARLLRVADRPEKRRRDVPVDTAKPGRSASDRKVGEGATAKRNTKLNRAGMTSALEDSAQQRPSRKSTRRSTGRSKRDSNLKRRQTRRVSAPTSRARRAAARTKR